MRLYVNVQKAVSSFLMKNSAIQKLSIIIFVLLIIYRDWTMQAVFCLQCLVSIVLLFVEQRLWRGQGGAGPATLHKEIRGRWCQKFNSFVIIWFQQIYAICLLEEPAYHGCHSLLSRVLAVGADPNTINHFVRPHCCVGDSQSWWTCLFALAVSAETRLQGKLNMCMLAGSATLSKAWGKLPGKNSYRDNKV